MQTLTKTCIGCEREFDGHPQRLYCTEACKHRTKARKRYIPRLAGTRVCILCKAPHYRDGLCFEHRALAPRRTRNEKRSGTCTNCGAAWVKDRKTATTLCHDCLRAGARAPLGEHCRIPRPHRATLTRRLTHPRQHPVRTPAVQPPQGRTHRAASSMTDHPREGRSDR